MKLLCISDSSVPHLDIFFQVLDPDREAQDEVSAITDPLWAPSAARQTEEARLQNAKI